MSERSLSASTGEGDTVFVFGSLAGPSFGQMVLSGGKVLGYDNARESTYLIDGPSLEFLDATGRVTSRFQRIPGPRNDYVGGATDSGTSLHLTSLITVDQPAERPALTQKVLVNSVPKSGTYWLREALVQIGFAPSDLHLFTGGLHDNRGLPDDYPIHTRPSERQVSVENALLPYVLPPGTVTVSHLEDLGLLARMRAAGMCIVNVTRDFEDVLASLFSFKLHKVDPGPGEVWREAPGLTAQMLGFAATYGNRDIEHVQVMRETLARVDDMPVLAYEDLMAGHVPAHQRRRLVSTLGSRRLVKEFLAALQRSKGAPTSTRSTHDEDPELRSLIAQLAAGLGQ